MHLPADLFRKALQLEAPSPASSVPLWELEFHAWEIFSGEQVMLDFSALTAPGGYWMEKSCLWPDPRQMERLILPFLDKWARQYLNPPRRLS